MAVWNLGDAMEQAIREGRQAKYPIGPQPVLPSCYFGPHPAGKYVSRECGGVLVGAPAAHGDRYLAIVAWARRRYTLDGVLTIQVGSRPSKFSLIEDMAAQRYLGCAARWK